MANRSGLIAALKKQTEIDFLPVAPDAIAELRSLKVPEEAIDFYREAEPASCAEIDGVRLWPIKNILEENTDSRWRSGHDRAGADRCLYPRA